MKKYADLFCGVIFLVVSLRIIIISTKEEFKSWWLVLLCIGCMMQSIIWIKEYFKAQ
jgi:hypothetical protein